MEKVIGKINVIVEACLIVNINEIRQASSEGAVIYETLKRVFTYKNPKFLENEKWGRSNFNTPKFLKSYEVHDGNMHISRGCLDNLISHVKQFNVDVVTIDRTLVSETIYFNQSNTILRDDQNKFAKELLQHTYGSGVAYTSFGKTVVLLEIAKRVMQRTLVIVHTTFLQEQWINEMRNVNLFNIDPDRIGGVGGIFSGKKRRLGDINVCLYHSLMTEEHLKFFEPHIGLVLFDEGQKSPIEGVQAVVNRFRARYRYTVSADLKRKDGKEFLTFDTFGPVRSFAEEQASDSKILSRIYLVPTGYRDPDYDNDNDYTSMISKMARDKARNIFICKRALRKVKEKKLVLIFVERKEQAAILYRMLSKSYRVDMLLGPINKKSVTGDQRTPKEMKEGLPPRFLPKSIMRVLCEYDDKNAYKRIIKLAAKKNLDIIIGTQKAEVGFSVRTIDHLVITTPAGNNSERIKQIFGRAERTYKQEEVDYFGHEKPIPTVDVLVDKTRASRNAAENIATKYGKRVVSIKKKTEIILRKKGEKK